MSEIPKLHWIVRFLSRRQRIALLEALAWPEFEVTRRWLRSDASAPGGFRVDRIPLADTEAAEEKARLELMTYMPPPTNSQNDYAGLANYLGPLSDHGNRLSTLNSWDEEPRPNRKPS